MYRHCYVACRPNNSHEMASTPRNSKPHFATSIATPVPNPTPAPSMPSRQRLSTAALDGLTPLRPAHAAARELNNAETQLETWGYAIAMLREEDEEKVWMTSAISMRS